MSDFKPGDRVYITSRRHPWSGHTGVIAGPYVVPSLPDLKWTVSVDGAWGEAAVADSDIRLAQEGTRP